MRNKRQQPGWLRGCIFDLDGTLVDSVPLIVRTSRLAWAELGLSVEEAVIRHYIGYSLVETGDKLLGPGRGVEYADAYLRHYTVSGYDLRLFPGVRPLLDELRAAGVKLALATAKREEPMRESLRLAGLDALLEATVYSECTARHKPFPDPALYAAAELGLDPADCLFVGDSVHDIGSGQAAGMAACGVCWGAGTAEELAAAQPEYLVETVAELRQLLLTLAGPAL